MSHFAFHDDEHQIASVMRVCLRAGLEISFCCMWRAELNSFVVVVVVNEAYEVSPVYNEHIFHALPSVDLSFSSLSPLPTN